jgi:hypothetical protein
LTGLVKYSIFKNQITKGRKLPFQMRSTNGMNADSIITPHQIRLPFTVPYYAQTASPEWAEAVFERGADPAMDPRWEEWGAADRAEYAAWCGRACGAVCVKMCVEALGGPRLPVMEWVRRGLALDGYATQTGPDGSRVEIGWVHAALVSLIESAGVYAAALRCEPADLCRFAAAGRPAIASVSYELGTALTVTRRGGHLVVVSGADLVHGQPGAYFVHNPSGRTPELRENARIDALRFSEAFSGRAIVVSRQPIPISNPSKHSQEHRHAEPR